ncbi:MAG: aminopeptidase [Clostridia bacterium]|nr:aminopeptidase [Clostridia bacterium]
MSEKTRGELLSEKLLHNKKNGFDLLEEKEIQAAYDYCEGYKDYLDNSKTERVCAKYSIAMAEKCGFVPFEKGMKLKAGDKVYFDNRGKTVAFVTVGTLPITEGIHIAAAHIDSPRLDLKPNPVFETDEIGYFKTHYYGGIKKYQWLSLPLSLYGTAILKDGSSVDVSIGDNENDPVFCIPDLLPHLAKDQMSKTMSDAVNAEAMNVIIGSRPFCDDKVSQRVKLNVLNILFEKYNITEEDFVSAEFELVPSYMARDIGLDRSLIGSYGHDDRVCAYPSITALFDAKTPAHTIMAVLADKEEIGSNGVTGMKSEFLKYVIEDVAESMGEKLKDVIRNCKCLSTDVSAAHDPNYPEVTEIRNSTRINYGFAASKYTGSRGKSSTSDASAEFVGYVRNIFDKAGVIWQIGEMGKVDQGGGGTVAMYIAELCMDVLDLGVPVLGMHAAFEVVSKLDVYMAYKGIKAFFEA